MRGCPAAPVVPQIDGSLRAGYNCGPAVGATEVRHGSCGRQRPTPTQVRERMRKPSPANGDWSTNSEDRARAVRSYGLRCEVRRGRPMSELAALLDAGQPVGVTIDLGVVAERLPALWSSATWRKGHIVWLRRRRRKPDGNGHEVRVLDPLADGRALGGGRKAALGPQWWPWWLVVAAIEGTWGRGRWGGTLTYRTAEDQEPSPVDKPPQPPAQPEPKPDEAAGEPDEPDPLEGLRAFRTELLAFRGLVGRGIDALDAVLGASSAQGDSSGGVQPEPGMEGAGVEGPA
jgi:hypothetical protein